MSKKILIVDDEEMCVMFLSMALENEGFSVAAAHNINEALTIGFRFHPDVLITDLMLKEERDGLTLAKLLQADFPDLRVIIITGLEPEGIRERSNDLGIFEIMVKPIELDRIFSLLQTF